jgi:rhodanese-related sulfurtransferase
MTTDTRDHLQRGQAFMLIRWFKGRSGPSTPETRSASAATAYRDGTIRIVEVRETNEWAAGHVPGAIHIPLGELASRSNEVERDKPVVVVCRSGRRSLAGATTLLRAGFGEASSLSGGMVAWARGGHPVEQA